jgi:hypothetical protein
MRHNSTTHEARVGARILESLATFANGGKTNPESRAPLL